MNRFPVSDTFQISGRGTVVVIDGQGPRMERAMKLIAHIHRPDGTDVSTQVLAQEMRPPPGQSGFLIALPKSEVPPGSAVEFLSEPRIVTRGTPE